MMEFNGSFSSYVIISVLAFASGVAVTTLWREGWCQIKDMIRIHHNRDHHSEGC